MKFTGALKAFLVAVLSLTLASTQAWAQGEQASEAVALHEILPLKNSLSLEFDRGLNVKIKRRVVAGYDIISGVLSPDSESITLYAQKGGAPDDFDVITLFFRVKSAKLSLLSMKIEEATLNEAELLKSLVRSGNTCAQKNCPILDFGGTANEQNPGVAAAKDQKKRDANKRGSRNAARGSNVSQRQDQGASPCYKPVWRCSGSGRRRRCRNEKVSVQCPPSTPNKPAPKPAPKPKKPQLPTNPKPQPPTAPKPPSTPKSKDDTCREKFCRPDRCPVGQICDASEIKGCSINVAGNCNCSGIVRCIKPSQPSPQPPSQPQPAPPSNPAPQPPTVPQQPKNPEAPPSSPEVPEEPGICGAGLKEAEGSCPDEYAGFHVDWKDEEYAYDSDNKQVTCTRKADCWTETIYRCPEGAFVYEPRRNGNNTCVYAKRGVQETATVTLKNDETIEQARFRCSLQIANKVWDEICKKIPFEKPKGTHTCCIASRNGNSSPPAIGTVTGATGTTS